ncbi:probable ZRT2 - Zinc transporter II [Melanopsichium pennsylvanicum]|uniref:Probable ZRT2 - Zinc transporter II n=2 Tax=Melanopsichium pennsylvanicum TaxID=63383 RepID=A0AAJ4XG53_9BASI|nr:probable ZRT2-Zinc transporter II [Melanopsichium pennsylvanicum 4]SNX81400.1 probable ZRT2 - Zinc transporter II [Melanopsichium pennsylvanicum]
MDDQLQCSGPADNGTGSTHLRIGAIFIIWVSSTFATLFPILTQRVPRLSVSREAFDFAKYFGSGVIIATAFIHLLSPAASTEELGSPCLSDDFQNYPFAFAFSMIAMFAVFVVEVIAYRVGSKYANQLAYDPHAGGHHHAIEHGGNHNHTHTHTDAKVASEDDVEAATAQVGCSAAGAKLTSDASSSTSTAVILSAQASEILGVMILEFGVVFHSIIIGITLGTTTDFTVLFIVIIFHQMFEGLGLGTRLAFLPLGMKTWIPTFGAILYGFVTPLGIAIGLGVRHTYNGDSTTAAYVTGVFDSVSSGILLYTGTVELLAHEFIFNEKMRNAPLKKVIVSILEMFTGAGLMALLGRWA